MEVTLSPSPRKIPTARRDADLVSSRLSIPTGGGGTAHGAGGSTTGFLNNGAGFANGGFNFSNSVHIPATYNNASSINS